MHVHTFRVGAPHVKIGRILSQVQLPPCGGKLYTPHQSAAAACDFALSPLSTYRMLEAARARRAARSPSCRLLLLASCSANVLLVYHLLAVRSLYTQPQPPPQSATQLAPPSQSATRLTGDAAGRAAGALWLTVAIMTVPRNEDYLTATLESFAAARPVETSLSVEVLVLSSGATHPAFERARQQYAGDALFRFETNEHRLLDRRPQLRDEGDRNKPGYRVRQQTRDFVSLLRLAAGRGAAHLLTMEDDFLACPLLFVTLGYVLGKAHATQRDWAAVRVSYGLAGVLLRGDDLLPLAAYVLERHEARKRQ